MIIEAMNKTTEPKTLKKTSVKKPLAKVSNTVSTKAPAPAVTKKSAAKSSLSKSSLKAPLAKVAPKAALKSVPQSIKASAKADAKKDPKYSNSKSSLAKLAEKLEAILLTSGEPITLSRFNQVLSPLGITNGQIKDALGSIEVKYKNSVMELVKGAGGYAFHVKEECAEAVNLFKSDKPTRYSRALMETLAIIAYKQPVTKAEIEELRGVTISTGIMRTLQEHEWIKIVGYNDVPGKPAVWGTTKEFLDNFKLTSLSDLPPISKEEDASAKILDASKANAEGANRKAASDADAADVLPNTDSDPESKPSATPDMPAASVKETSKTQKAT